MNHAYYLDIACTEGALAKQSKEAPAGAALVKSDAEQTQLVSQSHNRCRALDDPVATAEMDCIRRAGRRNDQKQLTLYTTRYPDMLCAGTMLQFSIGAIVIGLPETSSPAISLLKDKGLPVTFLPHAGCAGLADDESL